MIIENLFPTPIGFFKFEEELEKNQIDFIANQKRRNNIGNTNSADKYILKNKNLLNIYMFIEKCAHEYFVSTVYPKDDVKLRITQSWLNWTKPGQYHHKHSHANSFISGCFYIKANRNTDKIFFEKNEYQPFKFDPVEWNTYNSRTWWFSVGSGDLIFFPSSLMHNVETVEGDEERISLAFNMFPVGHLGAENDLTALYL